MGRFFKDLQSYLTRILAWATIGSWILWVGLVLPPTLLVLLHQASIKSETIFRWTGGALQLAGFALAMINLLGTEKTFGKLGPWGQIKKHFADFPRWPHTQHLFAQGVESGADVMSAHGSVRWAYSGHVEADLEALKKNLALVDGAVAQLREETRKRVAETEQRLKKETFDLAASLGNLRQLVTQALVGSAQLEWLGIWYFCLGISLATLSVDLAYWFTGVRP